MAKKIALILIKVYRYLFSPLLGTNCRFYPSCSKYAEQAINQYGILFGAWLTLRRIVRCNPWCLGGYDPIPKNNCINKLK